MITYSIKVTITNSNEQLNELGFFEEHILMEKTFTDDNPLSARNDAFIWYVNYQDIFNDSNKQNGENIIGIEDILSDLHKLDHMSIAPTLELWYDNEEHNLSSPYVNRIIYGNTTSKIEQINNLAKELKYYKRNKLSYNGSRFIEIDKVGVFEIIDSTPYIDERLYQYFT